MKLAGFTLPPHAAHAAQPDRPPNPPYTMPARIEIGRSQRRTAQDGNIFARIHAEQARRLPRDQFSISIPGAPPPKDSGMRLNPRRQPALPALASEWKSAAE